MDKMLIEPPFGKKKNRSLGKYAFLLALGIAFVIFIPFIIKDRGYFVMYGDFNVQQIPFYQLAHRAIRSGDVYWSWYTDLGSSFLGSYSFYLLFSPFFWLTLPFPNEILPYLMAPLLMLKTACAAFTAYLYLERFVKNKTNALIGALLYSFSGWMFYNTFYNHFHEVLIFFPLLLYSLERLVTENKKVLFLLMVTVNAVVNYWFFVGEVVFVIIYIIIRWYSGDWGINLKKFLNIAVESVLGLLLGAAALVPSILAISDNPRTSADRLLEGWGLFTYWHDASENGGYPQRLHAIISSFFFPPEHPAYANMFPGQGAKWSSISAWLPMFSMIGVIAFFLLYKGRKHWLKKALALFFTMSLIPALNALFTALNRAYYARWFYMLTLLTSLATIIAFDNIEKKETKAAFKDGIKWVFIITTFTALLIGFAPVVTGEEVTFGLAKSPSRMWIWYFFVVLGLGLVALLIFKFRHSERLQKATLFVLTWFICVFGITYFFSAQKLFSRTEDVVELALGNKGNFNMPDEDFVRSDIYDDMDNLLMYWEMPTIQAFHSVVSPSIMEFYDAIGISRVEASRPSTDDYALRTLVSSKWLFIDENKQEQHPMSEYMFFDNQNGYNIYENLAHLPMGFAYDHVLTTEQFEKTAQSDRTELMLKGIQVEEEKIEELSGLLTILSEEDAENLDINQYTKDYYNRSLVTADSFQINKRGFISTTNLEKESVMFYSVPYDKGWTAYVGGKEGEIIKANVGFMALVVPPGHQEITFVYSPPGIRVGLMVTAGTGAVVLLYFAATFMSQRRRKKAMEVQKGVLETKQLTWEEYLTGYSEAEREQQGEDFLNDKEVKAVLKQFGIGDRETEQESSIE